MCKPNLPLTICSNVEELGGGTNTMFNYTPLYANGKEPVIEELDVYRIEIPYISICNSHMSRMLSRKLREHEVMFVTMLP